MLQVSRTIALLTLALILPVSVLAQTSWEEVTPLPTPRAFPAVAVLGGQIYVIGGRSAGGQALDVVERYDPVSSMWSAVARIDKARFNAAATEFNGQILLTGGRDGDDELTDDTEVYDPIGDRWESFAQSDEKREGHQTFSIGNDVFAVGGLDETAQPRNDAEVYNESVGTWQNYGFWVLNAPRAAFSAVRDGVGVLVFGGFGPVGPVAQVEYFVPGQSGSSRAAMPAARGSLAGARAAGLVFAIGGRNAGGDVVARVDAYNSSLDQWESEVALPEPREGAVAAEAGGNLYVFGGQDGTGELSSTCLELMLVTANEPSTPQVGFALDLTGPNPFTNATSFSLQTGAPGSMTISVYDLL